MNDSFLRSEIEADMEVRMRSLTLIKTMSARYSFRRADKEEWLRCAFPVIYAEWEGFFCSSMALYFRQINRLNLGFYDIHPNYFVRNAEKNFRQLKEYPIEINRKHTFLRKLYDYFHNDLILRTDVNTENNLGFNVMNTILVTLNMQKIEDHLYHDDYSLKDDMNKFLLDTRNGIAHGNPSRTLKMEDITHAIRLVKDLMHISMETILKAYREEVFRN